jgi:hypothetical protein
MMMMESYRGLPLATAIILGSCVSSPSFDSNAEEGRAACAAQAYLQSNGYLAPLETFEPSTIDLELWDRMEYERDGAIDWPRLMRDRQGQFSGKLYGAGRRNDGYLVFYQTAGNFSCVTVSTDFSNTDLREANCRLRPPITRISERNLSCG